MREHIVAKAAMLSLRLYGLVIILQVATSWRSVVAADQVTSFQNFPEYADSDITFSPLYSLQLDGPGQTYSTIRSAPWNASDEACLQAFKSWSSASASWRASRPPESASALNLTSLTFNVTRSFYISEGIGDGFTTTACDGIPRFNFYSPPTRATVATVTMTSQAIITFVPTISTPQPSSTSNLCDCTEFTTWVEVVTLQAVFELCTIMGSSLASWFKRGSKCPIYSTADPQDPTKATNIHVECANTEPCPITAKTTSHNQTITLGVPEEQSSEVLGSFEDSFPTPPPNCTVDDTHCAGYWSRYRAERIQSGLEDLDFLRPGDGGFPCIPGDGSGLSPDFVRCGMEGERELVLIYWPPDVDGRNVCVADEQGTTATRGYHNVKSPLVVTIPAITFRGLGIEEFTFSYMTTESGSEREYSGEKVISTTVLTGPWTFTYPSIYLAHHAITHSKLSTVNEYGDGAFWSTTVPAGVITLQTSDIYSMRLKFGAFNGSGVDYARRVAKGQFEPFRDLEGWTRTDQHFTGIGGPTVTPFDDDAYEIRSFNFGDLQDPVPASLYFNGRTDCWGKQSHCATITGDTYRPMLKLRNKVWASLLPQAFACQRLQFVDPPLRLQRVDHVDSPQLQPFTTLRRSDAPAQTTAEPASQIKSPWAYPTAISVSQNAPSADETKDRHKSDSEDANGLSHEAPKPGRLPSNTPSFDQDPRLGELAGETPHRNGNPLAHQTLPTQAQPDNNDGVRSAKIGSKTVVVLYSSGTLLVVDKGTLTLRPGSSATIDGKVVYVGKSELLEDGSMIMAFPTTKSGGANGDEYNSGDADRSATYDSITRFDNFPGSTTKRRSRSSGVAVLPATSFALAAFLMAFLVL